MDATVPAMQAVDQNIISVLDDTLEFVEAAADGRSARSNGHDAQNGRRLCRPARHDLLARRQTNRFGQVHLVGRLRYTEQIVSAVNNAPTNPLSDQDSYTIVNVHPWSTSTAGGGTGNPMSNVKYIVDRLDADVEVVTLEELVIHLRNNYGTIVGNPVGQNIRAQRQFRDSRAREFQPTRELVLRARRRCDAARDRRRFDGEGTKAAAINQANADWRSAQMAVEAGRATYVFF